MHETGMKTDLTLPLSSYVEIKKTTHLNGLKPVRMQPAVHIRYGCRGWFRQCMKPDVCKSLCWRHALRVCPIGVNQLTMLTLALCSADSEPSETEATVIPDRRSTEASYKEWRFQAHEVLASGRVALF